MGIWDYFEEQHKKLADAKDKYEEMVVTGDELKTKGEEHNKIAYNYAKRRLEFSKVLKGVLESKKIDMQYEPEFRAFFRGYLDSKMKHDKPVEAVFYDSMPKAFHLVVLELLEHKELWCVTKPFEGFFKDLSIYTHPAVDDRLDSTQVEKDYLPLTKMDIGDMGEELKNLDEKYKEFL